MRATVWLSTPRFATAQVLRDVSNIYSGTTLFGKRLRIPVLCAPVGALENFDPGGASASVVPPGSFWNRPCCQLGVTAWT